MLQTFPNDDNATLMLAELKFRSNDFVNAISHYKYILNRKPSELMNGRSLTCIFFCTVYEFLQTQVDFTLLIFLLHFIQMRV